MKLNPYLGPLWWRLALLCAFIFDLSTQLIAQNQLVTVDSVQNFPLSTLRLQWAFDSDSLDGPHGEFIRIYDTAGGNDGIVSGSGYLGSDGFYHTARSTDPSAKLQIGPIDTRGFQHSSFSFHLAAPSGQFEHSDYVAVSVSLDGGLHFYPQLKLRGSKSGTSSEGWNMGEGIHYAKDFRYAVRSSSIYGHLHPDSKDSIDGIGAISITDLPETSELVLLLEVKSSTDGGEVFTLDNVSLHADLPSPSGTVLGSDTVYQITQKGTYICPDTLAGLWVSIPNEDTVKFIGQPHLSGTLHIAQGHVQGPLTYDLSAGANSSGEDPLGARAYEWNISDTGYHFIGFSGYFPSIDTLPYVWVYDPNVGDWTAPQSMYSRIDSGNTAARVVYLDSTMVPLKLSAQMKVDSTIVLGWADTCLDGSTPFGGWNLVANSSGRSLSWSQLLEHSGLDSIDATVYTWEQNTYGSFNPHSGPAGANGQIEPGEAMWVRLSHSKNPSSSPTLRVSRHQGTFKKSTTGGMAQASGTDTVVFDFHSTGRFQASYQATLYIDSAYSTHFMPCCDQIALNGPLSPGVSVLKRNTMLSKAHYPKSSFYPIQIVGEGVLRAQGAPGYFFLPPNVIRGTQSITLKGAGPHKVYWLGQDHPDGMDDPLEYAEAAVLGVPEQPRVTEGQTHEIPVDILGRQGALTSNLTLKFENGKWVKVVKVK